MYRNDFPIFKKHPELIYFDNAATHQLPRSVILAMKDFYESKNANPMRGLYDLSVSATELVHNARITVAKYLSAGDPNSIIFTRGTTDSLNLVSISLTLNLSSDDEIIIFQDSHHSNILPWTELSARTGASIRAILYQEGQDFDLGALEEAITPNTRIVAISAMSNVTGYINQYLPQVAEKAHRYGALVVVDAAQAIAHTKLDLYDLQADFLAFSGHKIGAPTGIGVLYGRPEILNSIRPAYFGGEMSNSVHINHPLDDFLMRFTKVPHRFEAGTINTGGIIGLAAAIDYWQSKRPAKLFSYIDDLTSYLADEARDVPGLHIHFARHGIFTFNIGEYHPHDVAQALSANHIAVRAGNHCAQPIHDILELGGPTVRASLSFYNTKAEVDAFVSALCQVEDQLGHE